MARNMSGEYLSQLVHDHTIAAGPGMTNRGRRHIAVEAERLDLYLHRACRGMPGSAALIHGRVSLRKALGRAILDEKSHSDDKRATKNQATIHFSPRSTILYRGEGKFNPNYAFPSFRAGNDLI